MSLLSSVVTGGVDEVGKACSFFDIEEASSHLKRELRQCPLAEAAFLSQN